MKNRFGYIMFLLCLWSSISVKSQEFFADHDNETLVHEFTLNDVSVSGDLSPFKYTLKLDTIQANFYRLQIRFTTEYPSKIPSFKVNINYPKELVDALWSSRSWSSESYITVPNYSRSQSDYNIVTAMSRNDENRLTIATHDDFDAKYTSIDINYRYRYMQFSLGHFQKSYPETEVESYVSTILLDFRNQPYSKSIRDASEWRIRKDLKYKVPEIDFNQFPAYSLWYPLHQNVPMESVTHYLDSIVAMGFRSVLIDDGWQNVLQFNVSPSGLWKLTDPKVVNDLIQKSHRDTMKVGLWMSKPFLGNQGIIASKFDGKYLQYRNSSFPLLDVRYPDVRDYLTKVYINLAKSWEIDAIDFNFLNGFYPNEEVVVSEDLGRDFVSVKNALDTLKSTIYNELNFFQPNLVIKQTYPMVGPLHAFNNQSINGFLGTEKLRMVREKVVNNRLLYGNKTPFMEVMGIDEYDNATNVALKFQSLLFGIPYVSYYSYTIKEDASDALRFWMKYWKANQNTLFFKDFTAANPVNHYPLIVGGDDFKKIFCLYDETYEIDLGEVDFQTADIINSTRAKSLTIKGILQNSLQYSIYDQSGNLIDNGFMRLRRGTAKVSIPAGGFMQVYVSND